MSPTAASPQCGTLIIIIIKDNNNAKDDDDDDDDDDGAYERGISLILINEELLHPLNDLKCALRYTCKQSCFIRCRLTYVDGISDGHNTCVTSPKLVMMYFCILQLGFALKGVLFLFLSLSFPFELFLFLFLFVFPHLFSYCKALSSEFLYCTASADVRIYHIKCCKYHG